MNFIKVIDQDVYLLNKEITLDFLKTNFKDLFEGLGHIGKEYDIQLKENVNPVI